MKRGIYLGGAAVLLLGALLLYRAGARVNGVSLDAQPKPVTALRGLVTTYRERRRYVGTVEPWVSASVGPQLVSAYVETVLVRPGDRVRRGQVLGTLDCRDASAASRQIAEQARALAASQAAAEQEAQRVSSLQGGGFVSPNEVEQKTAESQSKAAQLLSAQAQSLGTKLHVADCVLRAPFDGDVGERFVDPGAFVKPGMPLVTVVDRRTLRVVADVPESDFEAVAPQTRVTLRVLATGEAIDAAITRRAPAADPGTRTIHVEIDLPNGDGRIPSGTTAAISAEAGAPRPALALPLSAAQVREEQVSLFVVGAGNLAHRKSARLLGERDGQLFIEPSLGENALIVAEGRAGLQEGDKVAPRIAGERADSGAAPKQGGDR